MDAKGRKSAGLPGFVVLATGFGMLAAQFSAATRAGLPGPVALVLSAALIGAGTGLTGSLNEVLCVDVAPKGVDQPKFVGVWRMMTDAGAVLGPGLAGLVAGHFDVYAAAAAVTAACAIGASVLWSVKLER
jgi:cyanate permease